jgi:hypothetical protein
MKNALAPFRDYHYGLGVCVCVCVCCRLMYIYYISSLVNSQISQHAAFTPLTPLEKALMQGVRVSAASTCAPRALITVNICVHV